MVFPSRSGSRRRALTTTSTRTSAASVELAADPGRHAREPGRQRLEERVGEALDPAREDEDVGRLEPARHVLDEPLEADRAREAELSRERLQPPALGPVAEEDEEPGLA